MTTDQDLTEIKDLLLLLVERLAPDRFQEFQQKRERERGAELSHIDSLRDSIKAEMNRLKGLGRTDSEIEWAVRLKAARLRELTWQHELEKKEEEEK